jgi:lysozyme
MHMNRIPAPVVLLLALAAASASAQEFAGMDEFRGQLSGFRGAVEQQAQVPQAPVYRAMGSGGRGAVTAESLLEAAAIPNVSAYLVRGIDISHYQHTVDWAKVKTEGLSFVYVKATEGADGVDEEFAANWAGARTAGLRRGAYHFFNFCKGGAVQAERFIKTVSADPDALPPTVDLEESADCKTMPAKAAFRKNLASFVLKIQAAYGHQPFIYVNHNIYAKYFDGENDSYKIWIADIKHEAPDLPASAAWTMWQYAWHGTVAGISGAVDMDVFNGTPQMLAALNDGSPVMVASLGSR